MLVASVVVVAAGTAAFVWGCSSDEETASTDGPSDAGTPRLDASEAADTGSTTKPDAAVAAARARANIKPTSDGGTVNGTAQFDALSGGGVRVTIAISGATPGLHGMHIHQFGACGATDGGAPGSAAGGHWTVPDAGHGYPDGGMHHTGDMGNISINAQGIGSLVLENPEWTVTPGTYSVVNHAVIFHAFPDDGVSQPTGDAGARPGCGVIVLE